MVDEGGSEGLPAAAAWDAAVATARSTVEVDAIGGGGGGAPPRDMEISSFFLEIVHRMRKCQNVPSTGRRDRVGERTHR